MEYGLAFRLHTVHQLTVSALFAATLLSSQLSSAEHLADPHCEHQACLDCHVVTDAWHALPTWSQVDICPAKPISSGSLQLDMLPSTPTTAPIRAPPSSA